VLLTPGVYVRHPTEDWGTGQIQTVVGHKVTCNFPNAGKIVIDTRNVALEVLGPRPD
jgi:hypothetical protein